MSNSPLTNSNNGFSSRFNGHPKDSIVLPQKNVNSQLMQAGNFPSKMILDDLLLSQGSLRNEVMRNDETLQAVRQENIMLAEKVQHATNLYRQLLTRVSKTEERIALESSSISSVVNQAKQVEVLLTSQHEQMVTREQKLVMQVQRLQEEVSILKIERETSQKSVQNMSQEIRMISEKLSRQSVTLGTGLQDLKAYLDNKEQERKHEIDVKINELNERLNDECNKRAVFQTQTEGRFETTHLQMNHNEKSRNDDVYKLATLVREKEALSKSEVRSLQDKLKEMIEDYGKVQSHKDHQLRNEIEIKLAELDRKIRSEAKQMIDQYKDYHEEASVMIREIKEFITEETERIAAKLQNNGYTDQINEIKASIKSLEKEVNQNKKEIEKVVRAEISSRLSQGEKLTHMVTQIRKDTNDGLSYMHQTLSENKKKIDNAEETIRKDVARLVNDSLSSMNAKAELHHIRDIQKKIEDIEDALDDVVKQEEHIEMNSERIKQMEMENILAQGDINSAIDSNKQQILNLLKQNNEVVDQIKSVEKKLHYLAETFQNFKEKNGSINRPLKPVLTPRAPQNHNELNEQINDISRVVDVLTDVLSQIIDAEYEENKNDKQLEELKEKLDKLKDEGGDSEDDEPIHLWKQSDDDEKQSELEDDESKIIQSPKKKKIDSKKKKPSDEANDDDWSDN
ncbi:putative leucine-rich repeat-containing protein DDB_G0290503 isoform X3 [Hydra vulgaris]